MNASKRAGHNASIELFYTALAAIMALAAIQSCEKTPDPVPAETERTIIVYIAGDNNLSGEVNSKISALSEGFKHVDAIRNRLIVFADYRTEMPELIEITAEGPATIETYPSLNSADPENLKSVIAGIVQRYPADSYGLICFSHASGWLPQGALSDPTGYGTDSSAESSPATILQDGSDEMTLADFAGAIRLSEGQKYDFIALEACYMAGIEVAYELKDVADGLIASSAEILSRGFESTYKEALYLLFEDEPDIAGFAKAYFDHWNSMQGALRSATISAIDLTRIGELADEIQHLMDEGTYLISDPSGIQHFNRNHYHLFFDLTEYLEAVMGAGKTAYMERYRTIMDRTILYSNATPSFMPGYPYSFNIDTSCGLTVYIMQPDLERLNYDYEKTSYYSEILSN